MFDRWRKQDRRRAKGFADPDVNQRLAAIRSADPSDEETYTELVRVLQEDNDLTVQAGIIDKLAQTPEQTLALIQALTPQTLVTLRNALAERVDLSGLIELVLRVPKANQPELLSDAKLRSEEGLTRLERQSRNRDKAANRHARTELENLRGVRQALNELTSQLAGIDQNLLQTRDQDLRAAQRVSKLRTLLSKREGVALRLEQLVQQAQAQFPQAIVITPPAACPISEADLVIPEDPYRDLIPQLDELALMNGDPAAAMEAWTAFASAWGNIKERPEVELEERFATVAARFQRLQTALEKLNAFPDQADARQCQSLLRVLQWPDMFDETEKLRDIKACLGQAEAEIAASKTAQAEAAQTFEQAVKALEKHLDNGQYKKAVSAIKQARSALSNLPPGQQKANEAKLAGLSLRLNELRDWQKFATNPKRAELLVELEKIADQPAEAPQQAAQLRHLRQQWQQLGRPSGAEEIEQQQRFDELAERAYAPCAEYNAEQKALRAENLTARKAICEQLEHYLEQTDMISADLKSAEKIMRTARTEWQRLTPCDRKALKPVEQKFEALQAQLHGELKNHWDQNLQTRQHIIEQAKTALDNEDPIQGIETAKTLQQQWKNAGPAPRRAEQQLWQTFRTICDQIFAQRDAARAEQNAERKASLDRLDAAIGALELALQQSDPAAALDMAQVRELEGAISAARAEVKPSKTQLSRIDATQDEISARKRAEKQRNVLGEIKQWLAWDAELCEAEQTQQELACPHPVFKSRCAGQGATGNLLELVLEAEIAADIASPTEDQATRMALQIELMNQGKRNLGQADHKDLLTRWCAIGPKPADAATFALRERLERALCDGLAPR